jgi:hypothetical protein
LVVMNVLKVVPQRRYMTLRLRIKDKALLDSALSNAFCL